MILNRDFFNMLREAVFKSSTISINGKDFYVEKSFHVSQPRGNSTIPRDGNMSKTKYTKLLNFLPNNISDTDFAIIWVKNNKVNGITGDIKSNKIKIFTAIMKEEIKNRNKLFRDVTFRLDIGEQDI